MDGVYEAPPRIFVFLRDTFVCSVIAHKYFFEPMIIFRMDSLNKMYFGFSRSSSCNMKNFETFLQTISVLLVLFIGKVKPTDSI